MLEQIGHCGTSVVYLAEHVRLGRKAALKLLSPGFGDADFSDRFVRESQLAAGIDHPAVLQVYERQGVKTKRRFATLVPSAHKPQAVTGSRWKSGTVPPL